MKKKIRIIVADPAGNITIFVDEPFPRSEYQKVASQLLAMPELHGEQVAFIQEAAACGRADGKMEMCGLEFCGNASRSFGLLLAKRSGLRGKGQVFVDISGCSEILTIAVDTESCDTKVKMPNPREIKLLPRRSVCCACGGFRRDPARHPEGHPRNRNKLCGIAADNLCAV